MSDERREDQRPASPPDAKEPDSLAPPASASAGPLDDAGADALAGALGRRLARNPASPVWNDERFTTWLVRESAEHARRERRWTDGRVLAAGEALRARAQARRLRVAQIGHRPAERIPTVAGGPGDVLHEAAAVGATPAVDLGVAAGAGREIWDEPCEWWVELPPGTPPGRHIAIRIVGDSMAPLMHTGDTVLVRIEPRVERNTVIIARHPDDGYICKRVRRVTRRTIELDSLAPDRPVITIPRDERLIVGTVVCVWCEHRAVLRRHT